MVERIFKRECRNERWREREREIKKQRERE